MTSAREIVIVDEEEFEREIIIVEEEEEFLKDKTYYFHQTPEELCIELIKLVPLVEGDRVLEPFSGEGNFYRNFPDFVKKDWTEIAQGRDYTSYDKEIDWVITNCPFRLENNTLKKRENAFWKILNYYSDRAKKGMAYLVNDKCFGTLTVRRLRELNKKEWYIQSISCCSIKKWRGRYFWIIFEKKPCTFYKYIDGNF